MAVIIFTKRTYRYSAAVTHASESSIGVAFSSLGIRV